MTYSWSFARLVPRGPRRIRAAILLFVAFIAAMRFSALLFPAPAILFPATGIALGALFLEGISLWPIVYLASLSGNLLAGSPLAYLIIMPVAHALTSLLGAYLLRLRKVDPLFRSSRDMLSLIGVAVVSAVIVPTFGTFAYELNNVLGGPMRPPVGWGAWYVATMFSLLIIAPFIMRWFAKPRFIRQWIETIEIAVAFVFLGSIAFFLFYTPFSSVGGVSLVYFMLIPLFWIALRLRPRFVTLALLLLSGMAITSLFIGANVPTEGFGDRLFQTQLFLIIIAIIFYILSSLEEDRRVTTNLMRSQVATLENALARISSESRAKNDFIAVLAHELRNPLAPVLSGIELLRLSSGRKKEEAKLLSQLEDRMKTVRRLLDDLLDVSRISERKLVLEKQIVDLRELVEHATDSTAHDFRERHQQLRIEMPDEALPIEADPVRMEQVVTNLLTNASKYSHTGGRVIISAAKRGGLVELTVRDQGIGIAREFLDKIFEPFHQIETGGRSKKGLGIGLALVRSLVELHGGRVSVSSEGPGKGSAFTLLLHLSEKHAEPMHPKSEPAFIPLPGRAPAKGKRILVVDDNDLAAWGVGKLLELRSSAVDYAYDGGQALERARERAYDVIILDIGLPDQDGYQVARTLRERGYAKRLIALTGYGLDENIAESKEAGFDFHLVKPVGLADLKRVIPGL